MFTLNEALERVNMPVIYEYALMNCYNQSHRHYHNIEHIKEMLKYVPVDHNECEIVIDAILFHDLVYMAQPTPAGLNESLSVAEYIFYNSKAIIFNTPFAIDPENGESVEYERRVIEAITATNRHLEDQRHLGNVSKLVLDLDLSTFALPWNEYCVWKDRIEKENNEIYGKMATADEIKYGRYQFLDHLLNRKQLFYIKTEWEIQARENLKKDMLMCLEILDRTNI